MLPFQYDPVPSQLDRHLDVAHGRYYTKAESPVRDLQGREEGARPARTWRRLSAHRTRGVGAMAKRAVWWFLPGIAVFVASSTVAYALNHAVVGAATSGSAPAEMIGASAGATSHLLVIDTQRDVREGCLSLWRHVTAEMPDIHGAGLELFVQTECGSP